MAELRTRRQPPEKRITVALDLEVYTDFKDFCSIHPKEPTLQSAASVAISEWMRSEQKRLKMKRSKTHGV